MICLTRMRIQGVLEIHYDLFLYSIFLVYLEIFYFIFFSFSLLSSFLDAIDVFWCIDFDFYMYVVQALMAL